MWFVTMIIRNLWNRKIRTGLTCLGMAVAVCAVVTMIGVADVFEQAVAKLLKTARCGSGRHARRGGAVRSPERCRRLSKIVSCGCLE